MAEILPSGRLNSGSLADVLPSALASLLAKTNPLNFPKVRSTLVILFDGFGAENLRNGAGHARFLNASFTKKDVICTTFPSTTAAALTTFATGALPGVHGIVGYKVLHPGIGGAAPLLRNQLSELQGLNDEGEFSHRKPWQLSETVFEQAAHLGIRPYLITDAKFADTGFTHAVLRGAQFRAASTFENALSVAQDLLIERDSSLIYLYVNTLDTIGHRYGSSSNEWHDALELHDAALSRFVEKIPKDVGVLVTGDHGMVDVPAHRHVELESHEGLLDGVEHIGGEPRCISLYFNPILSSAERRELSKAWKEAEGHRSWVFDHEDLLRAGSSGPFGPIDPEVLPRIGDITIAARAGIAYYSAHSELRARQMLGQHGSATDVETRIPLIRLGHYGRKAL